MCSITSLRCALAHNRMRWSPAGRPAGVGTGKGRLAVLQPAFASSHKGAGAWRKAPPRRPSAVLGAGRGEQHSKDVWQCDRNTGYASDAEIKNNMHGCHPLKQHGASRTWVAMAPLIPFLYAVKLSKTAGVCCSGVFQPLHGFCKVGLGQGLRDTLCAQGLT